MAERRWLVRGTRPLEAHCEKGPESHGREHNCQSHDKLPRGMVWFLWRRIHVRTDLQLLHQGSTDLLISPVPADIKGKNLQLNLKQIMPQIVLMNIRRRQQVRKDAGYERDI